MAETKHSDVPYIQYGKITVTFFQPDIPLSSFAKTIVLTLFSELGEEDGADIVPKTFNGLNGTTQYVQIILATLNGYNNKSNNKIFRQSCWFI